MFEPVSLFSSNVPHTEVDLIGRLHGNELRPFSIRTVRDLDHSLALSLLTIDPRDFVLMQIDVRSGTIRSQVGIVNGRDYERSAWM